MANRNVERRKKPYQHQIKQYGKDLHAVVFFNVLSSPQFLNEVDALLPEHRERHYPPAVTLSMFIKQALEDDRSLQKAVDDWAIQRAIDGLDAISTSTAAYCKARQRIPLETVRKLMRLLGNQLSARALASWRWRDRSVKLVDGTGLSMPDTPQNQTRYPQPSTQAAGVGFPLARLVVVICLSTGGVLDAAIGPHAGKGSSELSLLRELMHTLEAGDVLLGDALYCSYFVVAALQSMGVDVVLEQHGARTTDFRRGQRLGVRDHRTRWTKPTRPEWMTPEQYDAFAHELTVREVDIGGKILVSTLTDQRTIHKGELLALYEQRWHVELDIRNIKTTMGMDVLSCMTPEMVDKEVMVYLLAYNMIRLLMAQAALQSQCHPRQLSFRHAVQLWIAWITRVPSGQHESLRDELFVWMAQIRVGHRPGRVEPRARKRRPKPYPWLKESRQQARQRIRRKMQAA